MTAIDPTSHFAPTYAEDVEQWMFYAREALRVLPIAPSDRGDDASLADEQLEVGTEDAHAMVKRLAREQGLLVGVSAAAAIVGSLKVAEGLKKQQPAVIVTILCDSGNRYLSERFWEEG